MVFLILAIMALLLLFVFKTYRSVPAAVGAMLFLLGVTSAVLAWGVSIYSPGGQLRFFNNEIGSGEFYLLIAAWYGADLLCSALIIRNLRAYKKVNAADDHDSSGPGAVH